MFKGAEDYIHNGYEEYNDAVDKIIEVALKIIKLILWQ